MLIGVRNSRFNRDLTKGGVSKNEGGKGDSSEADSDRDDANEHLGVDLNVRHDLGDNQNGNHTNVAGNYNEESVSPSRVQGLEDSSLRESNVERVQRKEAEHGKHHVFELLLSRVFRLDSVQSFSFDGILVLL